MAKDYKELKEILEEDYKKFNNFIQETKKSKIKMLNPKISAKLIASVSVCEYITALKERVGI